MQGLYETLSLLDEARGDGPKPAVLLSDGSASPTAWRSRAASRSTPRRGSTTIASRSCSRTPIAPRRSAAIAASRSPSTTTPARTSRRRARSSASSRASTARCSASSSTPGTRRSAAETPLELLRDARRSRRPRAPQGRRPAAARRAARRGRRPCQGLGRGRVLPARRRRSRGRRVPGRARRRGYDGWLVVEQDQVLRADRTSRTPSRRRARTASGCASAACERLALADRPPQAPDALSGTGGVFAVAAIDHRDALTAAHAKAGLEKPTREQVLQFKARVIAALAPHATGVMLDPEAGGLALASGAPGPGPVVMPLEAQVSPTSSPPDGPRPSCRRSPARAAESGAGACQAARWAPYRPTTTRPPCCRTLSWHRPSPAVVRSGSP